MNKINEIISRIFFLAGRICFFISKKLFQSHVEKMVVSWRKAQGDKILRLNYDLDEHSIVFDLGGYEGQWSSDIFSKYCCTSHIFEPVSDYYNTIKKRFEKNSRICVYQCGLSSENKIEKIAVCRDNSSIFKNTNNINNIKEIKLVKASEFIQSNNINHIDLMKINIEGGEYDLLEHLINSEFIKCINNIQIQFHDFVPNAKERMLKIQQKLEKTHYLTYQYIFVWENWKRKTPG